MIVAGRLTGAAITTISISAAAGIFKWFQIENRQIVKEQVLFANARSFE